MAAISDIVSYRRFIGLSTETKPNATASGDRPGIGDAFYESDTQNQYQWTGSACVLNASGVTLTGGVVAGGSTPALVHVFAPGELRVTQTPVQLFNDTFDTGTLDITNRWATPTTGGTGIAATNAVGQTVLDGGTTLNSYSSLISQTTFNPTEPGFLYVTHRINVEFPVLATGYRFWGLGIQPGTPTIATPMTEAVGFEVYTDGKLYAVTYQTGTRVVIADLSSATGTAKQPVDSNAHKYFNYFRGDTCYWAIDDVDNTVASYLTGANGPNKNILNIVQLCISNAGTHVTMPVNGVTVGDTAHTTYSVADGTFGWRKQRVDSYGNSIVSTDGSKPTYEYGVQAFTPIATPTAFLIIKGSSTKTVRIKKIRVAGVATAQGDMQIQFSRWSTVGTPGSAALTALTAVKHDINDPSATATVSTVGTANYTTQGTGSAVPFLCDRINLPAAGTGAVTGNEFQFATRSDKALILRGTSDFIVLSGNGSAVPAGGVFDISVELEEDNS